MRVGINDEKSILLLFSRDLFLMNTGVKTYKFELNSHSDFPLSEFINCNSDFEIQVEDDWFNETFNKWFYLESRLFNGVESAEIAYAIAKEILDLFNGYVQLSSNSTIFKNIEINKCFENNIEKYINFNSIIPHHYILQNLEKTRPMYRGVNSLRDSCFHTLMHIAKKDTIVYCLMKFCSLPISWGNLYKIFETLKYAYEHGSMEKPWTKTESSKKLTHPANKYDILGLDARHGYIGNDKDISFNPQDNTVALQEARDWLMPLVFKYLVDVANSFINKK